MSFAAAMRRQLHRRLPVAAESFMHAVGLDVRRRSVRRSPGLRRARLLTDANIDVVLDVGANCGEYGLMLRRHGYLGRIVSFEPLQEPFRLLTAGAAHDRRWRCERIALGSARETASLHVAANDGASSSFLPMTSVTIDAAPYARYCRDELVEVFCLDDVADDVMETHDRAYLKLDVQGFEGEVLKGAGETLSRAQALEIEVSMVALYSGQPLVHDILATVHEVGFTPVSFEPAFVDADNGQFLQADVMFLRTH